MLYSNLSTSGLFVVHAPVAIKQSKVNKVTAGQLGSSAGVN
jgi:hypothetical protein